VQRFQGKDLFVTGAASGIGRAAALRLAGEGGRVLCADRDDEGAQATAAEIAAAGGRAESRCLDVTDADACQTAIDETADRFGKLDVLCNIAGIGVHGDFAQLAVEDWQRLLSVNLSGPFYLSKAAIPHLLATRGNIVNMASAAGLVGTAYSAAYSASKGGLVLLTRSLAVEFGRKGVRVNCICPGGVETPMTSSFALPEDFDEKLLHRMQLVDRIAKPDEIAAMVAYVASDEAKYVNGAALSIDGGQVA
jgi:meso-butanediol dehydrogenase/(S,S)-butanediol dehydrogenase/diacetyl reductase